MAKDRIESKYVTVAPVWSYMSWKKVKVNLWSSFPA